MNYQTIREELFSLFGSTLIIKVDLYTYTLQESSLLENHLFEEHLIVRRKNQETSENQTKENFHNFYKEWYFFKSSSNTTIIQSIYEDFMNTLLLDKFEKTLQQPIYEII